MIQGSDPQGGLAGRVCVLSRGGTRRNESGTEVDSDGAGRRGK